MSKETTIIEIEEKIYPMYAIIATSYKFLDKYYVFIEKKSDRVAKISIKSKGDSLVDNIRDEFLNELLSVRARLSSSKRNKKIREFIVGRALFSSTEDENNDNYSEDDPLGINVPWN